MVVPAGPRDKSEVVAAERARARAEAELARPVKKRARAPKRAKATLAAPKRKATATAPKRAPAAAAAPKPAKFDTVVARVVNGMFRFEPCGCIIDGAFAVNAAGQPVDEHHC